MTFEKEWGLPWDATAGKTPVLHLIEGLRRTAAVGLELSSAACVRSSTRVCLPACAAGAASAEARNAALRAFERNVTFLDTWLRRQPGIGPLRFTCDVPPS